MSPRPRQVGSNWTFSLGIFPFRYQYQDSPHCFSPEEFSLWIVDKLDKQSVFDQRIRLDYHWRPQSELCPFCTYNFSVYAKVETLQSDNFYIFNKVNNLYSEVSSSDIIVELLTNEKRPNRTAANRK